MIEVCEQTENEWRSENIRIGLKQRAANGTSGLYDRPCYGYYKDKNGMHTGDVALADSGGSGNQYMLGDHHIGIISKEQFEAVQIERAMRSNVERTEEGWKRRSTKYSSKRKK